MKRPIGIFKHDEAAQDVWGSAYRAIPKSVFAMAAWHLSDCASDAGVGNGQEWQRFADEIRALRDSQIISSAQAKRALAAIAKAEAA